jgi:hypothetical protein
MTKDTCLDSSLSTAQSLLLRDLEGYQSSQRVKNNDEGMMAGGARGTITEVV